MGITFRVDHEHHEVLAEARGPIGFEDIKAHIEDGRRPVGLGYRELVDAREATPAISSEDVRRVVDLLRPLARQRTLGVAAVVVATDVAFGMMRMFEMLVEELAQVRAFRSIEAARAWLDSLE